MSHLREPRLLGAAAAALLALTAVPQPASAAPSGPPPRLRAAGAPADNTSVATLLRKLHTLYADAESASEAYDATAQKLRHAQTRAEKADKALSSVRKALAEGRVEAGRLARKQYRRDGIGLPASVQLLLTGDPENALEQAHFIARAAGHQAVTVDKLAAGEQRQRALTAKARTAWKKQRKLSDRKRRQRDTVRKRLHDVERMLASLSADQLSRIQGLESRQRASARRRFAAAVGPADGSAAPSAEGARALRYALDQVGKPYRYGADGPGAFDCSGLTWRAWRHAGESIPRTSGQQWRRLEHVSLQDLRPGDVVVYYANATHVGLYAGNGRIVHAPRPGEAVRLSPVGDKPVKGAVRPG